MEAADEAIQVELKKAIAAKVTKNELEKAQNKTESSLIFGEISVLNKAMNLAIFEVLGDANEANNEVEKACCQMLRLYCRKAIVQQCIIVPRKNRYSPPTPLYLWRGGKIEYII